MGKKVIPIIVISQFFCTSVWFAGNAVMADMAKQLHLEHEFLAYLTSAVQLGFIVGTLIFAILSIADRFSPIKVFFTCAIIAACCNLGIVLPQINETFLLGFRFLTGFFLAGIYPVGMKIAADHEQKGLGRSLGFLVGALVFGTSFPHFLKSIAVYDWPTVIYTTSTLSVLGGFALYVFVPNGPFRKVGQEFKMSSFLQPFKIPTLRSAAFGYFGHQWELYTFWVFVPIILGDFKTQHPTLAINVPLLSFAVIGIGSLACVASGLISQLYGAKRVALIALAISGSCCLFSPFILAAHSLTILLGFLLIWGMAVVADSPLYSTLIAQNAMAELKGTALTIVTSLGFAITIVSIQLVSALRTPENSRLIYLLLAPGPIFGIIAMLKSKRK